MGSQGSIVLWVILKAVIMSRFNWQQLDEIRKGIKAKVDFTVYLNPDLSHVRMRYIRELLEQGLPCNDLLDPSMPDDKARKLYESRKSYKGLYFQTKKPKL
jgi:hypothetical protein